MEKITNFPGSPPDFVREALESAFDSCDPQVRLSATSPVRLSPDCLAGTLLLTGDGLRATIVLCAEPALIKRTHPMRTAVPDLDQRLLADWLGELTNLTAGCMKSLLMTQGIVSRITPPSVEKGALSVLDAQAQRLPSERFWFLAGSDVICCQLGAEIESK